MKDNVEYYAKLILETLYKRFIDNPSYRIKNKDIYLTFGEIKNETNFKIAREQLIKSEFIYGKNVNYGNPPFLQITGEGLVYYERNYIIPSVNRIYTLLISRILMFLEDLGNTKYDIKKYLVNSDDPRTNKVEIPLSDIDEILKDNYDYQMNKLKWNILYFTETYVSKHIMEINGIGIGNNKLSLHNPDNFFLNDKGYKFLKEVFLIEKFQKIKNHIGRNRITQLYDDLNIWILRKRWVDVTIDMGAIIEYCIDNYVEEKKLREFFDRKGKLYKVFNKKLKIILQNPKRSTDFIFKPQNGPIWKRIQTVLKDYRNYIHITKLAIERSPLDEKSIQNVYNDFEFTINILLNLD